MVPARGQHVLLFVCLPLVPEPPAASALLKPDNPNVYGRGHRVVKYFDFDEENNLEEIPMFWRPRVAPMFPRYARGAFDRATGHQAPPSFYLNLEGRSCAYRYEGLDIHVHPDSDYEIVAHVRPDRMAQARAFITAYYLDANGERLPGTERRSRLIGGDPQAENWEQAHIRLPGHVQAAFSIGLTLWVAQPAVWWDEPRPLKHIEQQDVQGGAWFDDLTVYRVPSIGLSSSARDSAHVFTFEQEPVLIARSGQAREPTSEGRLIIRDVENQVVHSCALPHLQDGHHATRLPGIEPGYYQAELTVPIGADRSVSRHLSFIKLPPKSQRRARIRDRFGVTLAPESSIPYSLLRALLERLEIRSIKIPIPIKDMAADTQPSLELHQFMKHLYDEAVSMVGVLTYDEQWEQDHSAEQDAQSLIDVLSKPSTTWQPLIANAVTRYESFLSQWQIGADGRSDIILDQRLEHALTAVRQGMSKLTTAPILAAPWSSHLEAPADKLPVDYLSISIPTDIPPIEIPRYVSSISRAAERTRFWLQVDPLPASKYHRLPRLADFAKRMLYAHQSQAEKIFASGIWTPARRPDGHGVEVDELFLLFRTIAAYLDDAKYIGELHLKDGVTCHAYDRQDQAVLVLWDDTAPLSGREHLLQLSGAATVTDLWGQQQALERKGTEHVVPLSPVPVFAHWSESWLVRFRMNLHLQPFILPSERTFHEKELVIANPRDEPISGSIKLQPPPGWQIRPSLVSFSIQPRTQVAKKVRMQAAPREPAGLKQISAKITIDASRLHQFEDVIDLELGLHDIDVWADLVLQGDVLVVRHGVTNRSAHEITFRSFVDAPMRKRQNLNLRNLQPDQSVIKHHVFERASELSGKVIRIGLKQEEGPGARVHDLALTVP